MNPLLLLDHYYSLCEWHVNCLFFLKYRRNVGFMYQGQGRRVSKVSHRGLQSTETMWLGTGGRYQWGVPPRSPVYRDDTLGDLADIPLRGPHVESSLVETIQLETGGWHDYYRLTTQMSYFPILNLEPFKRFNWDMRLPTVTCLLTEGHHCRSVSTLGERSVCSCYKKIIHFTLVGRGFCWSPSRSQNPRHTYRDLRPTL